MSRVICLGNYLCATYDSLVDQWQF